MASLTYPAWHQPLQQRLLAAAQSGRSLQSLLLVGQMGLDLASVASWQAHNLLCLTPDAGLACGQCKACQLVAADNHPDLLRLQAPEGKRQIAVDQVRAVLAFANTSAQIGQRKVVLVPQADQLGVSAANALLKVLEEPGSFCFFVLASENPGLLLPTIRSRCIRFELAMPARQQAMDYMQAAEPQVRLETLAQALILAQGRPLLALAQLALAEQRQDMLRSLLAYLREGAEPQAWLKKSQSLAPDELLTLLLQWLSDWIKVRLGLAEHVQDQGSVPAWQALPAQADTLMRLFDDVQQDQQRLAQGNNWNQSAWSQALLIRMKRACQSERRPG